MNKQPLRALLLVALSMGSMSKFAGAQTQAAHPGGIGVTAPSAATAPGAASSSLSGISSPSIFNGSTNITIPIHDFSLDNQDYGIYLGYNTQGVKIDEIVSPAGLHWNLYAAEGSITRVVRDLPDELNIETNQSITYYTNAPFPNDQVNYPNHKRYLKGKMVTYTEDAAQQAVADVYRDTECDDFIFSCGGRTITFNLGTGMNVFTHPHSNIKVSLLVDGVPVFPIQGQTVGNWGGSENSGILEFLIRDEQGTQYLFSRGDYESIPLYNNDYGNDKIADAWVTSKWVIKKVTFANGNEINYNYTGPQYTSGAKYYKQNYAREIWSGNTPVSAEYLGDVLANAQSRSCQLTSIQYPNGTQAELIYNTVNTTELGQKMLDEIRISSGTQCLRYKLTQAKVNKRWFLNSVKRLSCDGTAEEPYYSFEYNPLALPERLSPAQDYYGYYNGDSLGLGFNNNATQITIPKHNAGGGSLGYGNERLPNPAFAVAANLMKVKNGYGGEISFRYSGNTAANPFTGSSVQLPTEANYFMGSTVVDGLKVDSVIETEKYHPENSKITVYEYAGGQLFMPGGYFHYPDYIDSATNQWTKVLFQSMFLTAHQLIGGSNHGYSSVTEKYFTGTGEVLGKKQTTFSNMKDAYSNNQLNYYTIGKHYFEYPYTDKQYVKDWRIGLPMKIVEYDQNNRILKEVNNFYATSTDISASAYISNTKKISVNSGSGPYLGNGDSGYPGFNYANKKTITDTYYPYTGASLLRCTKIKTYVSDTRFVEDSTLYVYDDRNNIASITTQNSKAEKVVTVNVYNYNVAGPGVPGGPTAGSVLYNMTDAGLEKVVSVERWKQAATSSIYDQTLIGSLINTFTYQGGILKPKAVFDLKVDVPLGYTAYTGMSMGSPVVNPYSKVIEAFQGTTVPQHMEKSTDIKLTDSKANPLETQVNNLDLYKSMIWDTNTGNKLAEVSGARYTDIAFSGFESTVKGNLQYNEASIEPSSNVSGGGISGDYVLKALNVAAPVTHPGLTAGKEYILSFWCKSIPPPSFAGGGLSVIPITEVYSWNGWKLYTAHFTPANNSPVGFTAIGSPQSPFAYYLDDVRIYPATATMQTYNYTPLLGISSVADAQGHLTYYEYDKLGRPTLVRDQQGNIISKTKVYNGGGL